MNGIVRVSARCGTLRARSSQPVSRAQRITALTTPRCPRTWSLPRGVRLFARLVPDKYLTPVFDVGGQREPKLSLSLPRRAADGGKHGIERLNVPPLTTPNARERQLVPQHDTRTPPATPPKSGRRLCYTARPSSETEAGAVSFLVCR